MEFTLLWAALTGIGGLWLGIKIWNRSLPPHSFDHSVTAAVVGLAVGRLVEMIAQGTNPLTHPADILIIRGGVHTGAAAMAAVATYVWSTRARLDLLGAIAPAALLGLAGWHAGCLWRSACLGTATTVPWAFSAPGSPVARHPVELYAAVALMGAAFAVARLQPRRLLQAGAALAAVSAVRLGTEPFRLSVVGGPVGWYVAGLATGTVLAVVALVRRGEGEPLPT